MTVYTFHYDLDPDTTLGGDNASDYIIPSQSAIKYYVDHSSGGIVVDQTFDPTSINAQSGVAIEGELTTNYQAKLVSGSNIKTINGSSILGSGNLTISGLPSQTGQSGKFLTTNGSTASWGTATKVTFKDWSVS